MHHSKDCRVGANAHCERKHRRQREPRRLAQLPQCIADVLCQHLKKRQSTLDTISLSYLRYAAELSQRRCMRLLVGHAVLQFFFDGEVDMRMQLFIEIFIQFPSAEKSGTTA